MEENKKSLNLMEKKQAILSIIKRDGPCLPSSLSGKIGLPLLLTSALVSEMKAEKKLKVSSLKIGGSPLYYIGGQEQKLENFIKHLPRKEQETFGILKKQEVVDEEKLEPGHRVALRAIKDFAFPIHVSVGNNKRIFWRLHSIKPEDASQRISEILNPKKPEVEKKEELEIKKPEKLELKPEVKKPEVEKKEELEIKKPEIAGLEIVKKPEAEKPEAKAEEKQEQEKQGQKQEKPKKPKIKGKLKKDKEKFKEEVYTWIKSKGLTVEQEFEEEYGDDAFCIISANSAFGKLNFLIIAKQKKKLNDADLSLAYQQGQQAKMPVLFLTNGQLTKKAQAYLEKLGKFIVLKSL